MKFWAGVIVVAVLAALLFGKDFRESPAIVAARDTMRIIQVQRDTLTRTITVYRHRVDTVKASSDAIDTLVVIRDDSTIQTPDTVVVVPPLVVADLRALRVTVATQDTLIRGFREDRRLDSLWHIQDAKLPHKPSSPWGLGATCGVNPLAGKPACTVGVTYRVELRLPR